MRPGLIAIGFLLLFLLFSNLSISTVWCSTIDSWVDVDVISFNGENILFDLKVSVRGNHEKEIMWIRIEPAYSSGSSGHTVTDLVTIKIWRAISNVVYYEGMNLTVFSYFYSYNHSYYRAEPKWFGYLGFPWDEHSLVLYLVPSFNITMDEHPKICRLPSQNYEGSFQVRFTPTKDQPLMHTLRLDIKHSSGFVRAVAFMLWATIGSLYMLSAILSGVTALVYCKKRSHDSIPNLIRVSSAVIFFVPTFEIAFYSLKSPLPLVFSDILMIALVPWNAIIIAFAIYLSYSKKYK